MTATGRLLAGLMLLSLATPMAPRAATTRSFREGISELARGRADGMAVTRRGRLFLAPRLHRLGGFDAGRAEPAHTWAAVEDASGNLYVATGPDGQILRVEPDGDQSLYFQLDEPIVGALALDRDGALLAGGCPGGRIYRIDASGAGEVWVETEETYVWSLAVDSSGTVYAGTGERGRVLSIDREGNTTLLFDSDEAHIRTLHWRRDEEALLAGGAGRGLVYAIDPEGHAQVLHDDDLDEVVALSVEPGGSILAALASPPSGGPSPPVFQLRLPESDQLSPPTGSLTAVEQAERRPTLEGVIEGLAAPASREQGQPRGRVVRIHPGGEVSELWQSTRDAALSVASDPSGRAIFGTGEPARLYREEEDGDLSLLATLKEAQVTALVGGSGPVRVVTSNPTAVYRLNAAARRGGSFVSFPFDAGGPARWGSVRWSVEDRSARTELYTRTGNSAQPDATWSAWSPAMTRAERSPIVNPDGRFLQWRLTLPAGSEESVRVHDVTTTFEPHNRPPELEELRTEGSDEAITGPVTFLWSVYDPDHDPVRVEVEYRPAGEAAWSAAAAYQPPGSQEDTGGSPGWESGRVVWDASGLPEGAYEIRAWASDQPANPPGEGLRAEGDRRLAITLDRSPPRLSVRRLGNRELEVLVSDEHSSVRALHVLQDGKLRSTPRAEDGLCDGPSERFRLPLPAGLDQGRWTLRGVDAARNAAEEPIGPESEE